MDLGALAWVERDNKIRVDGDGCSPMVAGGITYSIVTIGTQCWTAENMFHAPTNSIPRICEGGCTNLEYRSSSISYYYNHHGKYHPQGGGLRNSYTEPNQPYNDSGYGFYYNWEAAMNGSTTEGAQGICATGWHIPSDDDWKILEGTLGMSKAEQDKTGYRGEAYQGKQLLEGGSSGFEVKDSGGYNFGTTADGENAGPDDYRNSALDNIPGPKYGGGGGSQWHHSLFWTSSKSGGRVWFRQIVVDPLLIASDNYKMRRESTIKTETGLSVRCLKD